MQNQQSVGYGFAPSAIPSTAPQQYQSSVEPATRQLEVPHQLDMLERNLAGVKDCMSALESRLAGTVLRPEAGIAGEKGQLRGAQSTPMSTSLQEANDTLVFLRGRIESMLSRMEV
jgi:hypothetical protein